ncbi:hypothetical protein DFH05DRAFT_399415 [Lentinula detonsa]|uniref:Uncharacterized protein n=1 Tax=Lentinula detonsa TaxID=2804962 RepID=A0A9W8TTW5_9AGAR|nr:hypothetical protein DFH05DRAFT_399415 [Lentinula detonsa]
MILSRRSKSLFGTQDHNDLSMETKSRSDNGTSQAPEYKNARFASNVCVVPKIIFVVSVHFIMTSQAQAFSPLAQLQGSFFKQPHMFDIHSDAKSAFTTTTLGPPSVEYHLIYAPGEFHYTGRFAPFEDDQDIIENEEEQQRNSYALEDSMQPSITSNLVDANAFENPRPAPHPTVFPYRRATETRSRNSSITTAVASAAHAGSIQPLLYSGSLPSRKNSALTIGQEDSDCATPTPTPSSPEAHETQQDRGRTSFRIAVHTDSRDLSPTSIVTNDGQRVRVTHTPVAENMRKILSPWEWYLHCRQSRKVHDSPLPDIQYPAHSDERPIFTNSFDGNKEIECDKTPSGGLIYSTERAWNMRNAPKAVARRHRRRRHYFGSDEDEVYVPLGRVIRSKFSDEQ